MNRVSPKPRRKLAMDIDPAVAPPTSKHRASNGAQRQSSVGPTARYEEKREAILAAAASLFNEQGLRGTTLADIAAGVGLVTTSVTYYYQKKEDLAQACFLRASAAHLALAREAAQVDGVAERIKKFVSLNAELLVANDRGDEPPLIYFNDIRALPETLAPEVFESYVSMFKGVRALLTEPGTNSLPRAALNARAHLLLSVTLWMRRWISRYEIEEYPRVAMHLADLLLHGLASEKDAAWQPLLDRQNTVPRDTSIAKSDSFLRVATELVNEKGYRGASVDEISARMNVTKGAFYYSNDTKLDLVTACFERTFSVLRGELSFAEKLEAPAWQKICSVVARLALFQLSDQGPLLRTSADVALPDGEQRISVRRTYQRLTERVANMLVDGMVDGSIRPCNPAIAAQLVASAINAAAELNRWVPGISEETAISHYARPTLLGLLDGGDAA